MQTRKVGRTVNRTVCERCPLRTKEVFRSFKKPELEYVSDFKKGEFSADRGATILLEGGQSAHLYTVLSGWVFRYKILDDGRRQILNYALPGDLIGLQGSLLDKMHHSIEALTSVNLCVFERDNLMSLFRGHPGLGFDVTWLAAREERILDEHLISIGRRTALERAAYLLAHLYLRAKAVDLISDKQNEIPITQQHVADTLGLSIVHTNKTLRKLAQRGLIHWKERGCEIKDINGLLKIASWDGIITAKRPII
ncbi:Crp/Fnr family transcriptional regulator [uncultured Cohaesibacter sp.]|uniref:Crp/Fnr family transcriptional regulator n=1 Tax=uncultured Cohaesibacter sp. TaxID=1002546 RepID=UPI0029C93613|nr:Crp/Fnr family transcriptional regulator [uncultured Cohaesibacter sp.]